MTSERFDEQMEILDENNPEAILYGIYSFTYLVLLIFILYTQIHHHLNLKVHHP